MGKSKTLARLAFFLPLALLIILFECVPLCSMVMKAFLTDGQLTLANFI